MGKENLISPDGSTYPGRNGISSGSPGAAALGVDLSSELRSSDTSDTTEAALRFFGAIDAVVDVTSQASDLERGRCDRTTSSALARISSKSRCLASSA